ncbi:MAG: Lrp/AsnC family transcriptional regulator [Clostridia bacterium]|nr:Lrp/AsnC family transcriptional regulator [Clostridia bacterium]
MDQIDKKLLRLLAENADITATELVPMVNLSIPAINKRIARLKETGVITRVAALTDAKKVGKPVIVFVLVVLGQFSSAGQLMDYVQQDEDILECFAVTGEYDYLLKICASDIDALEKKLLELKRNKGISKSYTLFTLMQNKFSPVPLPDME